jgi:hypothetical protein
MKTFYPIKYLSILYLLMFFPLGLIQDGFAQISFDTIDGLSAGGIMDFGDYDNDGYLDVVAANYNLTGAKIYPKIYHNNQNAQFTAIDDQYTQFPLVNDATNVSWVDYDKDGWADVFFTGYVNNGQLGAGLLHNNKNGTFTKVSVSLPGMAQGDVAWKDFNKDGFVDLLICGADNTGRITKIYRNDGNGQFTDIVAGLNPAYECVAAWVDYDNDSYLDAFITGTINGGGQASKLYRNNHNETFTEIVTTIPGVWSGGVSWGDYNNDNYPDLLLTGGFYSPTAGLLSNIYKNNGDGSFTDIDARLTPLNNSGAAWGDFDGDGDLDALIKGSSYPNGIGSARVEITKGYYNLGTDNFLTSFPVSISLGITSPFGGKVLVGDLNNDGALDVGLTSRWGTAPILANKSKYSITGTVTNSNSPFSGISIQITGDAGGTTVTAADGTFKFNGLSSGHYIIRPIPVAPFAFSPSTRDLNIVAAPQGNQNFVAFIAPTSTPTPTNTSSPQSTNAPSPTETPAIKVNVTNVSLNKPSFKALTKKLEITMDPIEGAKYALQYSITPPKTSTVRKGVKKPKVITVNSITPLISIKLPKVGSKVQATYVVYTEGVFASKSKASPQGKIKINAVKK